MYGSSLLDGTNVTLDVKGDRIEGVSGCNSYGGKATMNEDAFQVREVSSTARGCAG
ncbi:MAG: META domain-containing protein, partial [Rubrobacter sp.]|nr:META domain-containing protein [Rubrobacter sp.]